MDISKAINVLECKKYKAGLPEQGDTWRPNAETIAIDMAINELSTSLRTSESLQELKRQISELKMKAEKDIELSCTNAEAIQAYGEGVAYHTYLKLMEELGLGVSINRQ